MSTRVNDSAPRLPPCPGPPNCVCSEGPAGSHFIAPIAVRSDPAAAWNHLRDVLLTMPGSRIVEESPGRLRAEMRTRVFRFVDVLDFRLDAASGVIHCRSESRLGYWDLGVNRRRLERIRQLLTAPDSPPPASH